MLISKKALIQALHARTDPALASKKPRNMKICLKHPNFSLIFMRNQRKNPKKAEISAQTELF